MDAPCVFCGIVAGNEPASVVYRDDRCMAFMDIRPVTDGHLLVIPVAHATYLADLDPDDGARIFRVGQRLAAALRRTDGLRCEGINLWLADGAVAGQEVFHVHLHVLPRFAHDGFGLRFPPDYGRLPPRAMLNEQAGRIRANLANL
jgi:diadenosine tetraphosphate (Ap4A) HIT family hydrolase